MEAMSRCILTIAINHRIQALSNLHAPFTVAQVPGRSRKDDFENFEGRCSICLCV